jgi:EAL domain-containing protein (putative c-di-GMP-specific phosphodiesterase class I)
MENPKEAIVKMHQLKELGIQISIDDFGTGYSSLAYLSRFPINELKIDRSFVSNIGKIKDDEIIVKNVLSLGENLGLRVVSEGVETEEQLNFITEHGVDEIQGYLISRPLSILNILLFLNSTKFEEKHWI